MITRNLDILSELDGRSLYYTFIAGARKVIAHQIELNKINVFPVNDGDTGTNLAATIRAVIETLHPHRSYKITAERIADALLMNARGNSGIIFAQFLYGLSNETADYKAVRIREFAESVKNSVRYIYEAVANPVEGTMLTVIREWADFIYNSRQKFTDFNQMLLGSYEVLKKSLAETKTKLKILAKNNVVDAGAKGFVLFIEGIIEYIHNRNLKELIKSRAESTALPKTEEMITEEVTYRYCTEAVLKNTAIDQHSLKDILNEFGDSVVVAGNEKMRRIHVHTDNPADLFFRLKDHGTIVFQKADDMLRQSQAVFSRKYKIALVVDSTCDLDESIIEKFQIHIIPIQISFGENNYLDKVTLKPEQFYRMLDSCSDYPKTSQINEATFVNVFSHLVSHYDSVIAVILSDKLSGTYNTAVKAAEKISREFAKPVSVINSRGISGMAGLTVMRIAEALEQNLPYAEIVKLADEWTRKCKLFIKVNDVKYLIKGGRLSYTKGLIVRLLNICPVISLDDEGKTAVIDKTFSIKACMRKIISYVQKLQEKQKIWNYIILHANNYEDADWYSEKLKIITGKEPVSVLNISPVIGSHAGVGASAVALMMQ
ncbi:MAG: DegV family protein [Bacteroidales bacterium]